MKNQTINKRALKEYKEPTVAFEIFSKQDIFMASNDISSLPQNDNGNQVGWRELD